MRNAQETFRSAAIKDVDGDGLGEYGTLRELAGLDPVVNGDSSSLADPPFIDKQLAEGEKYRYHFALLLGEEALGKAATVDGTERSFFVAAWPVKYTDEPRVAKRSFYVDETGIMRQRDIKGARPTKDAISGPNPWETVEG